MSSTRRSVDLCLTPSVSVRAPHPQEQAFTDVEMPGQYLAGHEIAPEAVVYLDRIGANVGIVRRHATSYRRLALQGSDGRTVHFLVQTGQHWSNTCGAHSGKGASVLCRYLHSDQT